MARDNDLISFILLGGTSDLAMRLLLPGLGEYARASGRRFEVIGSGRDEVDDYQAMVDEVAGGIPARYIPGDATERAYLEQLLNDAHGNHTILYFALAPAVTMRAVEALRSVELPASIRFAMEKPYGNSAADADELDRALHALVGEDAIYRVDHFLSEPSVNAAAARVAAEGAPETLSLVFEEKLGLEGRAEFYDSTGAAEDMVQSHLIQSAARILAGGPNPTRVREVLESFELVPGSVKRGRYAGYADEDGVDPARETETLIQVELQTPETRVTLRTGKGFREDVKEIQGTAFAKGPLLPYGNVIRCVVERDHTAFVPEGAAQIAWHLMEDIKTAMAETELEEYTPLAGS